MNADKDQTWDIQYIPTADGDITAKIKTSEGRLYLVHSAVDPRKEAENLIESVDTDKNALYFVFGTGLGYHLQVLKEKITSFSRVVVLEPDKHLLACWQKKGPVTKLDDSRFLFLAGNLNEITSQIDKLLHHKHLMLAGNCRFVVLPTYHRLFRDWVVNTQKQIINLIKNRIFEMGNDVVDTLIGIRQIMSNIGEVASSPGARQLAGLYRGKPAIIVSAGPSLNKNVELLREVKGKALILCVDASLKVLLEKGITPDAVFSIERGIETYKQFYQDKLLPKETVLIAPPVVHPGIFKGFPGEKLVLLRANEGVNIWFESILQKGMIKMGTSVAHLAFGFARLVNAEPIIFIGQDLAYSPEGYSHGQGVSVSKKENLEEVRVWLDGYYGGKVPSNEVWQNFLTWFEANIADSDVLCIDATEGGARIKGTKLMTLKAAIDRYCNNSTIQPLVNLVKARRMDENRDDINRVFNAFAELVEFFGDLSGRAEKALWRLRKVSHETDFNNLNRRKLIKVLNKLSKNRNVLEQVAANKVAAMCFQTMVFILNQQLSELGDEISPGNVQASIKAQDAFYDKLSRVSQKIKDELQDIYDKTREQMGLTGVNELNC